MNIDYVFKTLMVIFAILGVIAFVLFPWAVGFAEIESWLKKEEDKERFKK